MKGSPLIPPKPFKPPTPPIGLRPAPIPPIPASCPPRPPPSCPPLRCRAIWGDSESC